MNIAFCCQTDSGTANREFNMRRQLIANLIESHVPHHFEMNYYTTTQLYRFKITHIVRNTLWTLA